MSTNSRIKVFLPCQEHDGSGRIVRGILKLGQPFCCVELDVECNLRVRRRSGKELNKKISEFANVDHMTMFGRPLWRLYASESYEKLLGFVIMKMLGGNTRFSTSNVHHVFTAVASRVCIDPCVNTEKSIQFSREAVENHLRLLIGIDRTTGMLKTATPSEPVVAEAAATLLVCNDGKSSDMTSWTTCIQMVSEELLAGGIIEKGAKGELLGRLLCILARDQLPDGLSSDRDFRYSRPFKAKMFLDELLGDDTVTRHIDGEIERRRAGQATKRTLPFGDENLDFREGWCNFNHFTFTTENLPTTLEGLQNLIRRLLRRNAALQLSPRQPDWDLLLPVYTGNINKPIHRNHLTAIFIQIKNRHQPEKFILGTESLKCFRPEQLGFCVQMEFGSSFRPPLARMRWPTLASEPFVFGLQVFGANYRTFPFLAKYPALDTACGNLVRTMETLSEFPDEPPLLQALNGVSMQEPNANARSRRVRYGGATGGAVGGGGADVAGVSDELGVREDMGEEDGEDTEDDGGVGLGDGDDM